MFRKKGDDGKSFIHGIRHEGSLWELLTEFLQAYKERTEALKGQPPIGETSIKQDVLAIIEMLKPLGPVPGDLGFAREEISTIHGLLANPPQPEPFTPFRIEVESGFIETGDIQSMQITDSQQFKITFPAPKDKKGFPAKVQDGSVAITVGNDTATVEPNPDDPSNPFSALVKGNRPGAEDGSEATAVSISADADLGEGVKTISKAVELMVTSGEATGFGEPTVGDAEEQA